MSPLFEFPDTVPFHPDYNPPPTITPETLPTASHPASNPPSRREKERTRAHKNCKFKHYMKKKSEAVAAEEVTEANKEPVPSTSHASTLLPSRREKERRRSRQNYKFKMYMKNSS